MERPLAEEAGQQGHQEVKIPGEERKGGTALPSRQDVWEADAPPKGPS